MKTKIIILVAALGLLLTGCSEKGQSSADTPEGALQLMDAENVEREIHVYGSHEVNEKLVLLVFRGLMNDKDIWVAEVHKEDGQWTAQHTYQMNGPFEDANDMELVFTSKELGYEMGYIHDGALVPEDADVFEIEGVSDWKIWIKSELVVNAGDI